jgi:RimJ/RimL family protein N-acetyltransferase
MQRHMAPRDKTVYLSPVLNTDIDTLFAWINDRETVLFNAPYSPVHYKNHSEWFDAISRRADLAFFGIRTTADDRLVGSCQLHSIHPVHRSAELQIRIGTLRDRGKGYGRDALWLLLRHGFIDRNLHRIQLHVFAGNVAAIRLYSGGGFREEGRLRDAAFIDGGYQDVLLMGLLGTEFADA